MVFVLLLKFDDSLSLYMKQLWKDGILKIFWNYRGGIYPYNVPLWFLRDLIIVAFLSPVVFYFVKHTKIFSVFILGFFYFTDIWFPVVSIRALFFFTFGAYFSIHGKNMIEELRKGEWFWMVSAILTFILSMYYVGTEKYTYIRVLFSIACCVTIINFASLLLERSRVTVCPFLSKTSFFIFASHSVYLLSNVKKVLNYILNSNNFFILTLNYFLIPIICVCICVCMYYVASKTIPKTLKILTGSR